MDKNKVADGDCNLAENNGIKCCQIERGKVLLYN